MSSFDFDTDDFFSHLDIKEKLALGAQETAVRDSLDDLKRISSEIAPIKDSDLRKSVTTETDVKPGGVVGEVNFSVVETSSKGRFNYALWIHEMDYELGEQSRTSPGTDGYPVGNKYLERPLKGESEKYVSDWAKAVAEVLDR